MKYMLSVLLILLMIAGAAMFAVAILSLHADPLVDATGPGLGGALIMIVAAVGGFLLYDMERN